MNKEKWKKTMALLVALALLTAAATGCNANDLGFFKLAKEVSELESFTVSANYEVEYDESAMYSYYYYYGDEDSAIKLKLGVTGEVVYSPPLDTYLNLKVKYGINSKDMPNEANIRLYNGVYYMPVKDYVNLRIELIKLDGYSDKMCTAIRNAAMRETGEYDYVILGDDAYLYQWLSFSGLSLYMDDIIAEEKEITDLLITTVTELFSGMSSGMTKAVQGGYAIEVTPEKAVDFYSDIFKYISQNKSQIRKGMIKFFENLPKAEEDILEEIIEEINSGDREGEAPDSEYQNDEYQNGQYQNDEYQGDEYQDDEYPYDEYQDDEFDWYSYYTSTEYYTDMLDYYLDDIDEIAPSKWDKDYAKLLLRGSSLNAQITKNGDKYSQSANLKLLYKDEPLLSLVGSSNATLTDDIVQEAVPMDNPISIEDLDTIIERAERRINYVKSLEMSWWSWYSHDDDGLGWIGVDIEYLEGSDWNYIDCINDFGTMYVPLREVCGWLGIEVGWDSDTKTAYAVYGGQKVEIEGRLYSSTTFVKIREFDKLGYAVGYTYDSEWGRHTVTLKRK